MVAAVTSPGFRSTELCPYAAAVNADHSYDILTIELGPYDDLATLTRDLANHAGTAATFAWQEEGRVVVSVSHSVTAIDGKFFGTVLLTTDLQST